MEYLIMQEAPTLEIESEISSLEHKESINLPDFLYHIVYADVILKIKKEGIKPSITEKAYSDYVQNCLFLSANPNTLIRMAIESNKADYSNKENIFIIKFEKDKLDYNRIFKYDESDDPCNSVFLYHGYLPYSSVKMIYVYE